MISPDSPIEKTQDDKLGRTPFAAAIAKAIIGATRIESFVIGINGKWGSGKSSLLNLCVEAIKGRSAQSQKQVDVLRFNPWNFADQNYLVLQFFRQFTGHLRKLEATGIGKLKDLVDTLDAYATALGPPVEGLPYVKYAWSGLRASIGIARKKLGLGQDLESLSESIATQLAALKRKTVVIIDDIDRLTSLEIRQVFQLVKISARFPYVIYLLAFDRAVVASALADLKVGSGDEYLEKIVQVSFDLPPVSESALTTMIYDGITDLLKQYPPAHFDNHRFQNVFHSGFRESFESLRDVRRFLNSLEFGLGMIGNEVNGVDFIGLEALRIFHPLVYDTVRNNKKLFAGYIDVFTQNAGGEAFKKELDRTLRATGDFEQVKDPLLELFPKLAYAFNNTVYTVESENAWEKDLRISSSRYFDLYFQLRLPNDEVSMAEIGQVLEAAGDPSVLKEMLVSFVESKRIVNAMASVRHRLSEVKPELLPNMLVPLLDVGDMVKQRGSPIFGDIPEFWHVRWAIFDVLDGLPPDTRFPTLIVALKKSVGLGTMVNVVALLGQIKEEKRDKYPELTAEILADLKKIVAQRIQDCSTGEPFVGAESLPSIIWAWKNWGDPAKAKDYIEGVLKDPVKTITFLDKFIYEIHSSGGTDKTVKTDNSLACQGLSDLTDLSQLQKLLQSMDAGKLSQNQRDIRQFVMKELDSLEASGLTPEQFENERRFGPEG